MERRFVMLYQNSNIAQHPSRIPVLSHRGFETGMGGGYQAERIHHFRLCGFIFLRLRRRLAAW